MLKEVIKSVLLIHARISLCLTYYNVHIVFLNIAKDSDTDKFFPNDLRDNRHHSCNAYISYSKSAKVNVKLLNIVLKCGNRTVGIIIYPQRV